MNDNRATPHCDHCKRPNGCLGFSSPFIDISGTVNLCTRCNKILKKQASGSLDIEKKLLIKKWRMKQNEKTINNTITINSN